MLCKAAAKHCLPTSLQAGSSGPLLAFFTLNGGNREKGHLRCHCFFKGVSPPANIINDMLHFSNPTKDVKDRKNSSPH